MLSDIAGGLKLAVRRWRYSLSVAVIFGIVSVVMSLILGDVLTEAGALRGGTNLRKAQAVVFTPVYPPQRVSETNNETVHMLQEQIDTGAAYSSVVNNLAVNEPDAFGGTKTIAVVGEEAWRMFPHLGTGCEAPCVLRGALLPHDESPVNFRGITFSYHGLLDRGAVWFDPNAAGMNLDSYQLLVLKPSQIEFLDEYEKEELITKTVLLNPEDELLDRYIHSAAAGSLYLVPSDLAKEQPERFASLMTKAALYVLALLAFSLLAVFAYSSVVKEIIRQESKAFFIRRLCGAPAERLAVRLLVFLAVSTLFLPLGACYLLWLMGPPVDIGAKVMAAIIALVYGALSLSALRATKIEKGVP